MGLWAPTRASSGADVVKALKTLVRLIFGSGTTLTAPTDGHLVLSNAEGTKAVRMYVTGVDSALYFRNSTDSKFFGEVAAERFTAITGGSSYSGLASTMSKVGVFLNSAKHVSLGVACDVRWTVAAAGSHATVWDTGIRRDAAGVVAISDGDTGYGALALASGIVDIAGAGSPEGAVTGAVGSIYRRIDGDANTTLYVKESGTGNVGWVAK